MQQTIVVETQATNKYNQPKNKSCVVARGANSFDKYDIKTCGQSQTIEHTRFYFFSTDDFIILITVSSFSFVQVLKIS